MNRLTHIAALLIVLCTAMAACNNDTCYDNGSSLPLVTFYLSGSQQQVPGLTIMGIGAPGDSLLADSSTLNEIYLPLRATASTTRYAISRWVGIGTPMAQQLHDTLTIDYEPVAYFHSAECGAMYNFDIHSARCTNYGIDSIQVLNTHVTNSRTPVLRIYFTSFAQ